MVADTCWPMFLSLAMEHHCHAGLATYTTPRMRGPLARYITENMTDVSQIPPLVLRGPNRAGKIIRNGAEASEL